MRYTPPEEEKEEPIEPPIEKPYYVSDQTSFIKYVTQQDPIPGVIDNSYLRKYKRQMLFSGKIKALAFIKNPKTIQLNLCMRNNLSFEMEAGLWDLADETVWNNIDNMQITRGTNGNLQNALITQKREWKDNSSNEKKQGFISNLFRGHKEVDQMETAINEG